MFQYCIWVCHFPSQDEISFLIFWVVQLKRKVNGLWPLKELEIIQQSVLEIQQITRNKNMINYDLQAMNFEAGQPYETKNVLAKDSI